MTGFYISNAKLSFNVFNFIRCLSLRLTLFRIQAMPRVREGPKDNDLFWTLSHPASCILEEMVFLSSSQKLAEFTGEASYFEKKYGLPYENFNKTFTEKAATYNEEEPFFVFGRSQLLLATGTRTPLSIANRRQETAPTSVVQVAEGLIYDVLSTQNVVCPILFFFIFAIKVWYTKVPYRRIVFSDDLLTGNISTEV